MAHVRRTGAALIPVVAVFQFGCTTTQPGLTAPARLVDGESSLENLIEFPDAPGEPLVNVYCSAQISTRARMVDNFCYRGAGIDRKYHDAIDKAARSAQAEAAVVSGKPQRITLYYRVMFSRANETPVIRVFQNWARDVEDYGNDYRSAQRTSPYTDPPACNARGYVDTDPANSMKSRWEKPSVFLIAMVRIDASGEPVSKVSFESASNMDDARCRSIVEDRLQSAEYLPGYHDGQPVDTTYVLPVGHHSDMEFR